MNEMEHKINNQNGLAKGKDPILAAQGYCELIQYQGCSNE